ncbi:MAG TPA: hypothetical protein PKU97_02985 [Kofleriaceae bacterium]|nr:hypothetical protein [Kofleriaceae bacterium]
MSPYKLVLAALPVVLATTRVVRAQDAAADPPADPAAAAAPGAGAALSEEGEEEEDTSSSSSVEKGTIGLGLYIGEPTGVAAKLYLEDDRALQGAFGFAFAGDGFQVHADYVFHPYILQDKDAFTMPVYVGPGLRFIQYRAGRDGDQYVAVGVRGVAGMLFDFKELPLDVFVEVAGVVEYGFADSAGFGVTINAGAGARYYF